METQGLMPSDHLQKGKGTLLLGEWYECDFSAAALRDPETLRMICLFVAKDSGMQIVGDVFHQCEPEGVTGIVLLAESHLAIHTWPYAKFVAIDVFVSNYPLDNTQKALTLYAALKAYFKPVRENFSRLLRGRRMNDAALSEILEDHFQP